jgi:hypothetical protein
VCKGWDGYHSFSTAGALPSFPYALVADCLHDVQGDLIPTASHEFVEAATDPIDGWYLDVPPPDLWSTQLYEEVVDLCQYELNVQQGPYTVQRVYSNSAAMGGGSPCIPVPQGEVFFDVTTQPTTVLTAPPGGSIQATLIGWSTGPIAPWPISTYIADAADFDPTPMLSQQTIGNGDQVQVTLHVPSSAASGQIGASFIFSDNGQLRFWPVAVQVQ